LLTRSPPRVLLSLGMWLFTRYGFFSVACARRPNDSIDPDNVMIRSRRKAHLQNLQTRFHELAAAELIALPDRDYRYRLIVSKPLWSKIVAELTNEQDWSNFKNEAARFQGTRGSDYIHALHRVWEVMYEFQTSE
jgi:hypothetical protein